MGPPLPPPASAALVQDLVRIVGAGAVSTRDADRLAYARDAWARDVVRVRAGEVGPLPELVVWPGSAGEVARVLHLAEESGVPVVPFGAGSGRAGGARPPPGSIVLDLKRLRRLRRFSEDDLVIEVEAGVLGARLERMLVARGYTLGHRPGSIGCSTVGGWLATRSVGQTSTLYGAIEDLTLGLELASPGRVRRARRSGVDWAALILGSEGCLGAITAAELRVRPLPEARRHLAFRLGALEGGVEALRRLARSGLRPASLRLYDALDTRLAPRGDVHAPDLGLFESTSGPAGLGPGRVLRELERLRTALVRGTTRVAWAAPVLLNRALEALPEDCLLVLGFEGSVGLVRAEAEAARELLRAEGAEDLGSEPGERWLRSRDEDPFHESRLYAAGLVVDGLEVAATWDRIVLLHRAVRRALAREAVVQARFGHATAQGCAIAFTFTFAAGPTEDVGATLARYDRVWAQALLAVHEAGGTVAHQGGVGLARAASMARERGPGGQRLVSALARAFDPHRVLNPGKLGVEPFVAARGSSGRGALGLPPAITAAVGEQNVSTEGGRVRVRPPDERALAALVRVAHGRGVPLATDQSTAPWSDHAVEVDLGRLEAVPRLSEHACFVECEAGVRVDRLEVLLAAHGLCFGPLHPRARSVTVGAALARGLLVRRSIGYGELDGICFGVRALLPTGEVVETRSAPRSSTGPDLTRAFVGAEGRFGLLTKATLRVVRRPRLEDALGFAFEELAPALEAARRALRRGLRPVASRVVASGAGGLWTAELAGVSPERLEAELALARDAARSAGGRELARSGPDSASDAGFDDAIEVATPWSRALANLAALADLMGPGAELSADFLTPEAAVIVARSDRAIDVAEVERVAVVHGAELLRAPGVSRPGADGFDDVTALLAAALDPSQILTWRARLPPSTGRG